MFKYLKWTPQKKIAKFGEASFSLKFPTTTTTKKKDVKKPFVVFGIIEKKY